MEKLLKSKKGIVAILSALLIVASLSIGVSAASATRVVKDFDVTGATGYVAKNTPDALKYNDPSTDAGLGVINVSFTDDPNYIWIMGWMENSNGELRSSTVNCYETSRTVFHNTGSVGYSYHMSIERQDTSNRSTEIVGSWSPDQY